MLHGWERWQNSNSALPQLSVFKYDSPPVKLSLAFYSNSCIMCMIVKLPNWIFFFFNKQLHHYVEVGYLRHPRASTIGSQLRGGDCTDGWQNLTNPAISTHTPREDKHPSHWYTVESGGWGWEGTRPPIAAHIMLLLRATLINKSYRPMKVEFHARASIPKPLTTIGHDRS